MTGLNMEPKVVGREQDNGERERERERERQNIAENEIWHGQ
jgi:hypothetical protein